MRVIVFHLLNDYSGSPRVLASVVGGMLGRGWEVDLVTSHGGVLDTLSHALLCRRRLRYAFSRNLIVRAFRFAAAQLQCFAMAIRPGGGGMCYVNTILPVGAAIGARLRGARVICHIHEDAQARGFLYRFLERAMQFLAHRVICVSESQRGQLRFHDNVAVVPNGVAESLARRFTPDIRRAYTERNLLMVASLRGYKGIDKFLELARAMPDFRFTLVASDAEENVARYLNRRGVALPVNLHVEGRQDDVAPFYNAASLVLNLSGGAFRETFGMTVAEGFRAGLPALVPMQGGVAELVTDGVNGYHINRDDLQSVEAAIRMAFSSPELYEKLAAGALESSRRYTEARMCADICSIIEDAAR